MCENPTTLESRLQALHALWEHTIRCMAHHGLHADDAAPVIATIQARIEALRSAGNEL